MAWLSRRLFRRALARAPRPARRPAPPLALEPMEDRVVPAGRPLALPVVYAGAGDGHAPVVKAYDAETGGLNFERTVYSPAFTGGVRVAAADFTRDGYPDVAVAPGPGGGPNVRVLDGKTGEQVPGPVGSFWAYEESFTGGLTVAAGEVDGDGIPDVITAAGHGGGPRVRVFSGADGSVLRDFFAFDPAFAGGVSVAAADVTGDGLADLAVGAGEGGAPHVKVYDLFAMAPVAGPLGSFYAFDPATRGGVSVGADALAGDVDADGTPDLAVGSGPGDPPQVKVFSGATGGTLLAFAPFGAEAAGGVRVALAYVSDDPHADVVVGTGPGPVATVRVFDGATGLQLPDPVGEYRPFGPAFAGGVWVAASNDPLLSELRLSAETPIAAKGQTVGYRARVVRPTGGPTPGGTVRFYDAVTNVVLGPPVPIEIGPDGDGYAGILTTALAVSGNGMGVRAVYSGDANYQQVTANGAYNNVAAGPLAQDCGCDRASDPGAGAAAGPAKATAGGVSFDGSIRVKRADLAGTTGDLPGQHLWAWASAPGAVGGGNPQAGTAVAGVGVRLVRGNAGNLSSVALEENGDPVVFFDKYYLNFTTPEAPAFRARYGEPYGLTGDPAAGGVTVTDGRGATFSFWGFTAADVAAGRAGLLSTMTAPGGSTTAVTAYTAGGAPAEYQTVVGAGAAAVTESILTDPATNTVTHRRKVGAGAWATVRSVTASYYTGANGAGPGGAGQLRTVAVKDAAGNPLDTTYYRYYTTPGYGQQTPGPVKFVFGPAAYERLVAALGANLNALSDAQVAPYADLYLEYDAGGRVSKLVAAGEGCSACAGGLGAYTYTYGERADPLSKLPNTWARKVVETLPDGTQDTYYANYNNDLLLKVHAEAGAQWRSAYKYDTTWRAPRTNVLLEPARRVVLQADPSAVNGYDEGLDDLFQYAATGLAATYLRPADGRLTEFTYAALTTATPTAAGDVAGRLKEAALHQGTGGAAVKQAAYAYVQAGDGWTYLPASWTAYRNADGTGAQTTTAAYTWQGSGAQPAVVTVTRPAVTAAQNGPGSATAAVTVYDTLNRPVWAKDAGGFLSYAEYDPATNAVTKSIADVDTTQTATFTSLPGGWATPAGGGLHLTATYEVDPLGRATRATGPNGRVDYVVYNDPAHEARYYPGWTGAAPTGPTVVAREDRARAYAETLTMSAAPAVAGGRPTGSEAVSGVLSLSREGVNSAGQVVTADDYFGLAGLTYTTAAALGTEGTHFLRTRYAYDQRGRPNRTQTPAGTVYRTEYDGLGRAVSEWAGTDDTPTTGYWSPSNTAGTDLAQVRSYEYDGGLAGDGTLTKVTERPGGGAADRVTRTWYDWRGRPVAAKEGVEASESLTVNRPLTYLDYDNLDQVVKARVYDGDGVAVTVSAGVPDAPGSSLLRARADTAYDELGRAYRSDAYGVDQATGAVGAALTTRWWYDARGLVAKTAAPGGRVSKAAYDGAGRVTAAYITDGGGDAAYADALTLTGDTVWSQSEYGYDAADNLLRTTTRDRVFGETATGPLGTPATAPKARVSYGGYYYDAADRLTAAVDVGTNGGTAWTRPGTAPARSDAVLVTSYGYDAAGNAADVTAPDGVTARATFDALGRTLTSTAAYGTADAFAVSYAYDASGRLLSATAPGSRQTRYAYDGLGRVSGVTERYGTAFARTAQYAYDQTDLPTAVTQAAGTSVAVTTRTAYDVLGRPTSVTEADGTSLARTTSTGYDALGRVVSVTGPRGFTSTVAYDDPNQKVTTTDPYGKGWTAAYDAAGNRTSLTNPYGKAWTWGYDLLGRVTSAADPLANTTQYQYTVTGDRDAVIDPRTYRTETTFDAFGRTASVIDPYGNATAYAYDRAGRVLTATDRRGTPTQFAYDNLGRTKTVTEAAGYAEQRATQYAYTAAGDLDAVTAPGGAVTKFGYDAAGRATGATEAYGTALARTTTTGYDLLDRVVSVADGLSHATGYAFDVLGRVTTATDPLSKTTTYGYDAADNLLWVQDASSNKTQYAYDKLDRVTTVTDPLGKGTGYAYDDAGRLLTVTDRLGRVRQFGYDDAGRRTGETWKTAGGVTVQAQGFGYDAAGNLTSATDPDGSYTIAYDKRNRASTVSGPFGLTLTFGYDANGNRTSAADSAGATQTSVYDRLDRLTSRRLDTATGDARADYTYTPAGGVDIVTRYADLAGATKVGTTDYDYDALNRATAITHKTGAGTTLAAYGYAYDAADRLTSKTENGTPTAYTYDNADQLTTDGGASFTYDATGNRTNTGYTTGTGNRMSSDGTWAYTYDDAGQLVKKSKGAAAETWAYAYDFDGRLTGASKSNTDGGTVVAGVAYAYDAFGNRLSRTETGAGGATVAADRFAFDGWDTAKPAPLGTEDFDVWADLDTSNAVTARRLFGGGFDEVTAKVAAGGAVAWYAADLTGSVRLALNGSGAVTNTAAYDAFGNLISGALADRYGYAGREREGVDGSYHNRDRVYRPEVGRFLSEDPEGLAPDVNPYRYAHNQPTTYRDPSGRDIYAQSVGDEGPEVTLETWLRSIERRARELAGYGPPSEKGIDKGEPGPPKPPSPFAQRHDKTLGGNSREEREAEARSDGNTGFAIGAAVVTAPIWVPFLGEFVLLQGGRWVVVQGANLGRAGVAAAPRVIDWGARAGNTVAPWVVQGEIVTGPGLSLPAFAIFGMKFGGIQRPWTLFGMHAGRGAPKHPPGGQGCPPPKDGPAAGPANGGAGNPGAVPPAKPAAPPPVQVPAPAAPAAPGAPKLPGVTVKEGKWDYFFGRVKSNPDNEARSLQNMKDLETLGIKEAEGGQAKLLKLFEEGKGLPEAGRHTTEYGVTITRTVKVGEKGAIDVKYFYPGGDLTATPEVSTIIPKIFK